MEDVLFVPGGVLSHILKMLCLDTNRIEVNHCLKAVRISSKLFRSLSDDARVSIKVCPRNLTEALSLISERTVISEIIFSLSLAEVPDVGDAFLLTNANFRLLSERVSLLDSLTVHGNNSTSIHLPEVCITQLPLSHNLRTLNLSRFDLLTSADMGIQGLPGFLISWTPLIPHLSVLKMSHASLTALDLSNSPKLYELGLTCNIFLTSLTLSTTKSVRKLSSLDNLTLSMLDLSEYSHLTELHVERTHQVVSLNLTGCTALHHLNCTSNGSLTTVGLRDCLLLQHLHLMSNPLLVSLDLSHLNHLQSLVCMDNVMTEIHCHSVRAQSFSFQGNNQLTCLDLSGCDSLSSVLLLCNDHLETVDLSGLQGLEVVSVEDNARLACVLSRNCPRLQSIQFIDNQSLEDIDCSGCESLLSLTCPDHSSLQNISFCGCRAMLNIDSSGCSNYVRYGRRS